MSDETPIEQLKALAHPLRLAILKALDMQERNVSDIEQTTGIGQPMLSQQLAVLRKSGLVKTRRAAKLVYYRVVPDQIAAVVQLLDGLTGGQGQARPAPFGARVPSPGAANFARLS